jgi:hypothetical protein
MQIGFGDSLETLRSDLPPNVHLWFLKYAEDIDAYYATDYPQISVLRDIGSVVRVIAPRRITSAYSDQHFPVPLDGTSFEDSSRRCGT